MGGNALKQTPTRRYEAEEYHKWSSIVRGILQEMFPDNLCLVIPSYKNKESFGDCDILMESYGLPPNWVDMIKEEFMCREMVKNGNVLSFGYRQLQYDIITVDDNHYNTAYNYFAYNDLSNLLGRVARKIGFKYGHDGLSYDFREGTEHFRNVVLLTDLKSILEALGYSYEEYMKGFNDLEDIFKFVVSSPFFSKDIFALENRNNAARTRDKKRKTYTEFLKWLEVYEETHLQESWCRTIDRMHEYNSFVLMQSLRVENFRPIYEQVMSEWDEVKKFRNLYNGDIVKQFTNLEGKELGNFMKWMKERYSGIESDLQKIVLDIRPRYMQKWIEDNFEIYKGELYD